MIISSRPEIKDLLPYKPGKPIEDVKREYHLEKVIKLASNENPLGPSPKAKEAIKKQLDNLAIYPDDKSTLLRDKLAEKFNISQKQILVSNGSSEMIDLVSQTYINKGDEIIMGDITFPSYKRSATIMGGKSVIVPLVDFTHHLDKFLEAITDKTKIIWLCNPNNPTGTIISYNKFIDFLDKVPKDVLVISDEAYREYVTAEDYPHMTHELLKEYPNLLILRTFSKIYGLASSRVGYTMANEEILTEINRTRSPFNVNRLGQYAALAALDDLEFVEASYNLNVQGKKYLYDEFDKLGFEYVPSETNHILVDVQTKGEDLFNKLQEKGIIIRPQMGNYIRVSIGTMEENKFFIEKLKEVI